MAKYNITKKEKLIHVAEKRTEKSIYRFEFEKIKSGWYVKKFIYDVDEVTSVTDMYIPREVVEQILLAEAAKDELVED